MLHSHPLSRLLLFLTLASAPATIGSSQEVAPAFPRATPASQGLPAQALEQLAAEVEGYVERDLFVGAELLVIKNRHTVLQRAFGSRDREEGEAPTPWTVGTVCNIRSMTKPITGAAAQILIDRGTLSLDDRVAEYLPGFDNDAARDITIRQILGHRAGLPLTILESIDQYETLFDLGNAVGTRGPEYEPDSRFWYSDAGTDVLGAIVEVIAGEPLDRFVQRELLDPLGMTDSFYYLDDEDPRRSRIASMFMGGVGNWNRMIDPADGALYPFAWGSQSLYSTPTDYARFLAMWMDGGRVGDRRVLSAAAVQRTLTATSPMSMLGSEARFPTSFTGLEVWYGQMSVLHMPIEAAGKGPATIIGHSGSDGTIAWAWPELDLMVLCFTQSRGGGAVLRLEEALDRLLIDPEAYSAQPEVPLELRPCLGVYIADWSSHMKEEFRVEYRQGKLVLDIPSQLVFELAPHDEAGKWRFAIAPAVTVWFDRDEEGNVDCLRIRQGPMTFEAPRKGSPRELEFTRTHRADPEVVGKYLGRYHDPEGDVDVEVLIDGDYVGVRRPDGRVFHLWKVPGEDAWQVRESPTVALTFQEEDGRVVSLTRHSPGGAKLVMPRVE
jgi:CubicO group peptidase (beta-lactamase class C family)